MFRRLRYSIFTRSIAFLVMAVLLWISGGHPALAATQMHPVNRHARKLEPHEMRAIRGRQTLGGGSSTPSMNGGPSRPWGFSFPDLGGYGQIGAGNQFIGIPLFGHGGRGLSFGLFYNTQSVPSFTLAETPPPPISLGWSHTFLTTLVITRDSVTLLTGSGTAVPFTQNLDGSYTPIAGYYDSLVQNMDGSYSLTHKGGGTENFTSGGKLTSQVDRNGNTTSIAYYTSGYGNGQVHTITDAGSRTVTLSYNSDGQLDTVTDGAGREWDLGYDSNYYLESVT